MRIDQIVKSVQVLVQADTMIADMQIRSALTRTAFVLAAFVIALFGLAMLGLAGYQYLAILRGPVFAALAIGMASLLLAVLVIVSARFFRPGRELEIARELHNTAFNSLVADVKLAGDDVLTLRNLLRGRFQSPLLSVVVPLVMMLIRRMRTRSESPAEDSDEASHAA